MDTLEESVGRMLEGIGRVGQRNGTGGRFLTGRVLSASPLRVACPDGELGPEDLWVNEALLPGWRPGLSGTLTGSGQGGEVTVSVRADQLSREGPALGPGDRVVLLTQDQQGYWLICKAVRP